VRLVSRLAFQLALLSTRGRRQPLRLSGAFTQIGHSLSQVGGPLTLVSYALALVRDVLAVVCNPFSPVGDEPLRLQVLPPRLQGPDGALASRGERVALVGDPLSLSSDSLAFLGDPLALPSYREPLIVLISARFQPVGVGRFRSRSAVRGDCDQILTPDRTGKAI